MSVRISLTLEASEIFLSLHMIFSLERAAVVWANLERISGFDPSLEMIAPRLIMFVLKKYFCHVQLSKLVFIRFFVKSEQFLEVSNLLTFRDLAESFYAPNFEEVEGAYWFGPVCLWLGVSVRYACIRSRTVEDRILKFGMWNKHEK